ncbi:MAG: helix-turn-helix domain-containing protein [Pseudomonadales bacterium]|nr:helix-turn-helix domain-containing protein [Pseudomonadales bacterium]
MNLGEKLRQLRQEKNLTQPELAETLGIEQSYLSKLENGKSLPSADVLKRILDAFGLGLEQLIAELDDATRNQLRHLPEVAEHFSRQKLQLVSNRKRWLLGSALLCALGCALIYAGAVRLFVSDVVYGYQSGGIILEGESKEIFLRSRENLTNRLDQDYLTSSQYRGLMFNIPVDGGTRTYRFMEEHKTDPWQNKAVAMLGVFLAVFGLAGLGLERRLTRS